MNLVAEVKVQLRPWSYGSCATFMLFLLRKNDSHKNGNVYCILYAKKNTNYTGCSTERTWITFIIISRNRKFVK